MRCDIVGENLFGFLCLGVRRGYFALEQLAYNLEETLEAYTNPAWEPTSKHHDQQLLDFLAERLQLKPWDSAQRFHDLQERYGGMLEYPPP